ncbi:MAG: capsule assembly Wzi family protein, partial [Treponema sp.]|nr:capsule assembly Wzi family protein [Treponema sp.]
MKLSIITIKKNTVRIICAVLLFTNGILYSQEALKSVEEEYYDFLALQGLSERPYLNYRTLSDSVWRIDGGAEHPWQGQNLGIKRQLFPNIFMRVYGPELFMSVNTAAPYGQNDGALWQGRGFNTSLTGGVRLEGYGVELTFKPQLAFSQNAAFDYIQPAYSGADYTGKAADYGYYGVKSIDAPQRFGDEPFFTFDWGDSEVRYTWKKLTAGFGTQTVWLGPAQINPIIHSNNAPSYPKFDIGLRKQSMIMPWLGWYLGDIEARTWWGYLSESDYFDNDSSNDHNMITGFSIAYGVPFLPGLSIGFNRTMLSKWDAMNYEAIFTLMWPFMDTAAGSDEN